MGHTEWLTVLATSEVLVQYTEGFVAAATVYNILHFLSPITFDIRF